MIRFKRVGLRGRRGRVWADFPVFGDYISRLEGSDRPRTWVEVLGSENPGAGLGAGDHAFGLSFLTSLHLLVSKMLT